MPIPRGARQVPGQPNRVRLFTGEIVTRSTARTMGAREMGYRNERERSKYGKGDDAYFNAWIRTEQGQRALEVALARAEAQGYTFRPTDLKAQLIAARNSKPSRNRPPGDAWIFFMDEYEMDTDDYVDY
jgi:hypothetical protein